MTYFAAEQSVLRSPVCVRIIAKYGHVSRISGEGVADFLCSPECVAEGEGFETMVLIERTQVTDFTNSTFRQIR